MANIEQLLKTKVIRNNDLYRIFISRIKSGPLDGGCWAMAVALQKVIGKGSLYAILSPNIHHNLNPNIAIPHHVVLKIGNKYIDADGISSEKQLLNRWIRLESLQSPYLNKFQSQYCKESPRDKILVGQVVAYLRK